MNARRLLVSCSFRKKLPLPTFIIGFAFRLQNTSLREFLKQQLTFGGDDCRLVMVQVHSGDENDAVVRYGVGFFKG